MILDANDYLRWPLCRMAVLNDFEACGYGVPALQPEDLLVLNDVPARQKVSPQLHLLYHDHRVQLHHAPKVQSLLCWTCPSQTTGEPTAAPAFDTAQHCQKAKVWELLDFTLCPASIKRNTPAPHHILKLCIFNSQKTAEVPDITDVLGCTMLKYSCLNANSQGCAPKPSQPVYSA